MVPVGLDDSSVALAETNADMQTKLLQVRPFGGTPIAAMLDDSRVLPARGLAVQDHQGRRSYFSCRERYAVLSRTVSRMRCSAMSRFQCSVGEGGGLQGLDEDKNGDIDPLMACADGKCSCPYDREVKIAERLREPVNNPKQHLLEKLWVVAFNVNDETAMKKLDEIAVMGGEKKPFAHHQRSGPEQDAQRPDEQSAARCDVTFCAGDGRHRRGHAVRRQAIRDHRRLPARRP